MTRKHKFIILILTFVFLGIFWDFTEKKNNFSEVTKITLRDIANQLLLADKDSTSLVLPITALSKSKYRLSFQNAFSFRPENLVSIVKKSFHKSALPNYYRVEVIQCSDKEVAYSYEIKNESAKDIVPCSKRALPTACYTIEFRFTQKTSFFLTEEKYLYLLIAISFFLLFPSYKKKQKSKYNETDGAYSKIGIFKFYPEQSKLVKAAIDIRLSKKECELLTIFAAKPNQIIKRDELSKKVWEDKGVFVGRSLDTYISKLRKKLGADTSIKFVNIHGIGYKLEFSR